jgi:hypothetical protein
MGIPLGGKGMQSCRRWRSRQRTGMQKNATLFNNQQNTSDDGKTNRHATNQQLNTTIDLHSPSLFQGRTEWRRENPFRMADGGAERNGMAFPNDADAAVPPPSTPVIPGLLDVKLHLRKSSIDPSSLAGFHPALLVVTSPSHHLDVAAGCRISSRHPLVAPPSRHLIALAACCIASCCPLVASPSRLLIMPAGCCVASCYVALSSSHCAALVASHCTGWLLSCCSSHCPHVILLFWLVVAMPLPPLLLLDILVSSILPLSTGSNM